MVRKHWAHRTNYEDSVKFLGIDLNVLHSYLEMAYSNNNTTYLSANNISQFLKCISDWMLNQTLCIIREHEYLTNILDKSIDESNWLKLSLIALSLIT